MSKAAAGKSAFGYCDRTARRYPIADLIPQYVNGKASGMLVGRDMLDQDQPQWRVGEIDTSENPSLRNPRPEVNLEESRSLSAWAPVGGGVTEFGSRTLGLDLSVIAGKVSIGAI